MNELPAIVDVTVSGSVASVGSITILIAFTLE